MVFAFFVKGLGRIFHIQAVTLLPYFLDTSTGVLYIIS